MWSTRRVVHGNLRVDETSEARSNRTKLTRKEVGSIMLKVHEVAKRVGITPHQVRNWTKEYQIKTYRAGNNYNMYDDAAAEKLHQIKIFAKDYGLSVKQIKDKLADLDAVEKSAPVISYDDLVLLVLRQVEQIEQLHEEIEKLKSKTSQEYLKIRMEMKQNTVSNKIKSVIDKLKND